MKLLIWAVIDTFLSYLEPKVLTGTDIDTLGCRISPTCNTLLKRLQQKALFKTTKRQCIGITIGREAGVANVNRGGIRMYAHVPRNDFCMRNGRTSIHLTHVLSRCGTCQIGDAPSVQIAALVKHFRLMLQSRENRQSALCATESRAIMHFESLIARAGSTFQSPANAHEIIRQVSTWANF